MDTSLEITKCILCFCTPSKDNPFSNEHIIPKSIGGTVAAKLLCEKCNNKFGTTVVSKVKEDPSIRMAAHALQNDIPDLFKSIEDRQEYITKDMNGEPAMATYQKGKGFVIRSEEKQDGSLIYDTKKSEEHIKNTLKKDGLDDCEIDKQIKQLRQLPNDQCLQLSPNYSVIKNSVVSQFPALDGEFIDDKVIALIAYEFLALSFGKLICDQRFSFLRDFINSGNSSNKINIERLHAEKYGAFHRLYAEYFPDRIVVTVELFGWLVFKVSILGFTSKNDNPVIIMYLQNKDKRTLFANSLAEAKKGSFIDQCGTKLNI